MDVLLRAALLFVFVAVLCSTGTAQQKERVPTDPHLELTLPRVRTGVSVDVGGMRKIADTTSPDGSIRQVQFADAAAGLQVIVMVTTNPPAASLAGGMDSLEKQIREQLGPKTEVSRDTTGAVATMSAFAPELNGMPLGMGAWTALASMDGTWLLVQMVKIPYGKGESTPFEAIVRSIEFFQNTDAVPLETVK